MNTIQKLNLLVFDNAMTEPADAQQLAIDLKKPACQIQSMRTVVSMLQRGYDLSALCADVIKLTDTSDARVKLLCNVYLSRVCADRPACQLMCTNTFLKDFNDRDWTIQLYATHYALELGDEILIKNYVYDLKRMCKHERSEVRACAARALAVFHSKSRTLFAQHGLDKILLGFINDKDSSVVAEGLKAIADVEAAGADSTQMVPGADSPSTTIISVNELFALYAKYDSDLDVVRAWATVAKLKPADERLVHVLQRLLHSTDASVFYLAASRLIQHDRKYTAEAFEHALGFLDLRSEQLYNMLLFVEQLLHSLADEGAQHCDRKQLAPLFVPHGGDPDYIKTLKMRLLLFADKSLSDLLARFFYEPKYNLMIIEQFLDLGIDNVAVLDGVAPSQAATLCRMLKSKGTLSDAWRAALGKFFAESLQFDGETLSSATREDGSLCLGPGSHRCTEAEAELVLSTARELCGAIPAWAHDLGAKRHVRAISAFFCRLLQRKVISKETCTAKLKELERAAPRHNRIAFLLKHIDGVQRNCIYASISDDEPDCTGREAEVVSNLPACTDDSNALAQTNIDTEQRNSTSICLVGTLPFAIAQEGYRGVLSIEGSELVLKTEQIAAEKELVYSENQQGLEYTAHGITKMPLHSQCFENQSQTEHSEYENVHLTTGPLSKEGAAAKTIKIQKVGTLAIAKIELKHIGQHALLEIGGRAYSLSFCAEMLVEPKACDKPHFEEQFAQLDDYAVLKHFDTSHTRIIDDTSFCFSVLGFVLYGKSYSDQVVLKGDAQILSLFQQKQ
ncbi:hypothetical protein PAPHI01_0866 [Pancytospora philotis]|nr:hypothetical protein PAPHI01_0866 [Pancytospora philotis]